MKILSLDTSATVATVAIAEDSRILAEYTVDNKNTHSESLLPMIEAVLSSLSLKISDIDLFALSSGPGSFTGVRIGAATVKGLAFGKDTPCIEVSTLEALAYNLVIRQGLICPVMNARRSQVYTALFRSDGERLIRLMPDSALAISELDKILAKYEEPISLVGDGYDITEEALKNTSLFPTPSARRNQSAASVAAIAFDSFKNGRAVTSEALSVNYLRPSQAERERAERETAKKE